MVIIRNTRGGAITIIRKVLTPFLVVFGFLLILFTANSKVSKLSNAGNPADVNDSGVAHADAPPSCGDSGDSGDSAASGDSSGCGATG
jgi:hypothetical protein